MKAPRKRRTAIVVTVIAVIVVLAAGYVLRDRLVVGDTAGAADSTVADSTVAAGGADSSDSARRKGRKDKDGKDEAVDAAVPVEIQLASAREISAYYVTTATLEPEKKVDLLAKSAGQVVKIVAEEGRRVKEGDLLARLDDEEQEIAVEEARINRDQRQRELERIKAMHDQDLISDKEFGDARYQYELALNGYESARLRYEWTQIRAPFDGVVTERAVDEGEHISMGSKLFVMADTDPLQITMYLPEGEMRSVRMGQTVLITPDVNPEMTFTGEVIRVAPEVDLRTGTVKVTAVARGGGIPGSFVRIRIVTDTHANVVSIPRRSLVADAGEHYVFVAEADTVRRVDVTLGFEDEHYAEITEGIGIGDTVVTAGVGALRPGTKIKVLSLSDSLTQSAGK